jgi:cobalamin biosynthesis protein CobD/CbiB
LQEVRGCEGVELVFERVDSVDNDTHDQVVSTLFWFVNPTGILFVTVKQLN